MAKLFKLMALVLLALGLHGGAQAQERGTADQATAMVRKAVDYLKANGRDKAFAAFNDPKGQFRDRDLYIMVYDMKGFNLAHGANPKLIGKDLMQLRDANGTLMIKEFIEVAKNKGSGWINYQWPNPVTSVVEAKSTYVEKYDDLIVGCGIYK
ncbi:cache domain-containing protein [Duganella qianjiadongensis]|uniref:Histidine kinase n=1 Tax=Duganella qianjiadongensis TaxID=2692176 RepID=A0ABW9VLC4_9BURK|nr:cache domain-containing protein [Duganella qianjiadongensis]MYM40409.1 histidine kinase [Duganella qianjiadongensis]